MPSWKDKPEGRLLNLAKGGGSLLDIGVYPVFLAYFLLGKPKKIIAKANFNTRDRNPVKYYFHLSQCSSPTLQLSLLILSPWRQKFMVKKELPIIPHGTKVKH